MFDVMGFGKPMDEIPMLLQPGVLSIGWGPRQLAAGLGLELDGLEEMYVREPAPGTSTSPAGTSPKGTAAALRFEVIGLVERRTRGGARARHPAPATTCARTGRSPHREGGNYRIEVTGEPCYALDLCLSSPNGDHNHAGCWPPPCASSTRFPPSSPPAGICTTIDLP